MGKAVLISIKPRWCELIASEKKTIEVRKTRPKMLAPFKCYIYCTKAASKDENLTPCNELSDVRNGKVIGEFTCDWCDWYKRNSADIVELALGSLVQPRELYEYMGQNDGLYGWHISGLQIYEQPKELSEFYRWWDGLRDIRPCENGKDCKHLVYDYSEDCQACAIDFDGTDCPYLKIQRPPMSWCYVEEQL